MVNKNKKKNAKRTFRRKDLLKYPGGEIISKGLHDIRHKRFRTIEALAVLTAFPRLKWLGFRIGKKEKVESHLVLYKKLQTKYGNDAHAQYNAVMKRVAKFCNHYGATS